MQVNCSNNYCTHNGEDGKCTKDEIELDYLFQGEGVQCASSEWDMKKMVKEIPIK